MTEKAFGNFELHVEFHVPYMPERPWPGPGQQRSLPARPLRGSRCSTRTVLTDPGQRLRRDLPPGRHAAGERLQASAPVAELRRHIPQPKLDNGKVMKKARSDGRSERDQDHRQCRDLAQPRRRGHSATGQDWSDHAPGPRQPGSVSQHLDQADRVNNHRRSHSGRRPGMSSTLTPEGCAARRDRLWQARRSRVTSWSSPRRRAWFIWPTTPRRRSCSTRSKRPRRWCSGPIARS